MTEIRLISWTKKGSRKQLIQRIVGYESGFPIYKEILDFPIYDCRVKVDDEKKLIVWIDCSCYNFVNHRIKVKGEFSDRRFYAEPCKHLKPIVDALLRQGYVMKLPKEYEGSTYLTKALRKAIIERAGGICEFESNGERCPQEGAQVHRFQRGSNDGVYCMENCKLLCQDHHDMIHGNEFGGCKSK